MTKLIISILTRKAVVEHANGRCECDIATHDHGLDECSRRPRYIVFREDVVHLPHPLPDSLMAVCTPCHSQIRYARG
jgi:hypothetical protein